MFQLSNFTIQGPYSYKIPAHLQRNFNAQFEGE